MKSVLETSPFTTVSFLSYLDFLDSWISLSKNLFEKGSCGLYFLNFCLPDSHYSIPMTHHPFPLPGTCVSSP